MRESALLMQTLKSYAVPGSGDYTKGTDPVVRSEVGIAPKIYKPQPLVREESVPRKKIKEKIFPRRGMELYGQEGLWRRRTASRG
jgi:hypothetical protein